MPVSWSVIVTTANCAEFYHFRGEKGKISDRKQARERRHFKLATRNAIFGTVAAAKVRAKSSVGRAITDGADGAANL